MDYNELVALQSGLEAISEVSMTYADYEQALEDAATSALEGYELISEVSLTQAEYEANISSAVSDALVGMEAVSEVSMTQAELDAALTQAATDALVGMEEISEVSLTQAQYEQNIQDAVDAALEGMVAEGTIPEGYILDTDQAQAISVLESQVEGLLIDLSDANAAISNLQLSLSEQYGSGESSSGQLTAAYELIEQMEDEANAQFEVYASDIAAYETFLEGLNTSMARLEAFLTDNYGYQPYDSTSIPNGLALPTTISGGEDFTAQPYGSFSGGALPNVYLNFAGKTIGLSRGYKNISGTAMHHPDMLSANGTEATFTLNENTKKLLWGAGIVILSFGAFKLIKTK